MSKPPKIETVEELVKLLGRDSITAGLGHKTQVVTRAITDNEMPAHWYVGIRGLCQAKGLAVPEDLFKWSRKSPVIGKQIANDGPGFQGADTNANGSAA